MEYKIKIDKFEGPLDLLLHLIKASDVDIYEISLEEVINQYLDYIKAMEELDLVIASSYLIMAAELIFLKSWMLLPKADYEEALEEDPRQILINKLIDYKQYKEMAFKFKKLEGTRQHFFTKLPADISNYQSEIKLKNNEVSVTDLFNIFQNLLTLQTYQQPLTTKVTTKELSIKKRMIAIKKALKVKKKLKFEELIDVLTKDYIIITFLSILELTIKKEIIIYQTNHLGNIYIELKGS